MRRLLALVALAATAARAQEYAEVPADEAIRAGVEWLVRNQNRDGSFGTFTSGRTWEVSAAVPGGLYAFRAATTAICWLGLDYAPFKTDQSRKAQERALAWLVKNVRVKRAHPGELYNTWAFGFGLHAIARALQAGAQGATEEELRATAKELVRAMGVYQTPDGGWGYYDFRTRSYKPSWSTSFTTATGLVALREAEAAGIPVPPRMSEKAKRNIWECRKKDGTYLYGLYGRYYPMTGVAKPQGSSLRTQACNLALRMAGAPLGDEELRAGLQQLVDNHRFALAGVRRPIPHESWYQVSGYFYLYGQAYAGLLLDHLPDADRRVFGPHIVMATLKARQPDGSFWDYPLYGFHKPYGTGLALIALSRATARKE